MGDCEDIIHGKIKKVGNSIAIFVSAEERDKYQLVPDSELVLALRKKKVMKSIFGAVSGAKYSQFTEKDRADYHGE